jgi:NADH:ubiquinone oxidoreductase subunit H
MMAYEPVIIMVVVGVYLVTGSFRASNCCNIAGR